MTFKHGQIMSLFDNPQQTMYDGIWMSGKMGEGEYKEWFENGQLFKQTYYKNWYEDGEHNSWFNNGQLYIHCFYKGGKLNGEYKHWNDRGELVDSKTYKDGQEI